MEGEVVERVDRCVELLVERGIADRSSLLPASQVDLAEAVGAFGALPTAYRRFLERVGRGAGHLLVGTRAFLPDILEYRDAVEALVARSTRSWALDESDIVFADHQGYTFLFMHGGGDDPPVFSFREGESGPVQMATSFTSWLCDWVEFEAAQLRDLEELGRSRRRKTKRR